VRVPSQSSASIRAAVARFAGAVAAAALLLGVITPAYADTVAPAEQTTAATTAAPADQASPAPAATPAGQTNPGPGSNPAGPNPTGGQPSVPAARPPARPAPAPTPLGHLPVIDFVATFTQPAYYGNRNALPVGGVSPVNQYDPLDVGGTVRFPITRKLNLLFDRITEGTLNQPLECVLQQTPAVPGNPAARVCPSDSRDIVLQYHATYLFNSYFSMDIGDSFRHRIWTNGGSGVSTVPFLCNNNGRSTGPNCTISST